MLKSKKFNSWLCRELKLLIYEHIHVQSCKLGLESTTGRFAVVPFVPSWNLEALSIDKGFKSNLSIDKLNKPVQCTIYEA